MFGLGFVLAGVGELAEARGLVGAKVLVCSHGRKDYAPRCLWIGVHIEIILLVERLACLQDLACSYIGLEEASVLAEHGVLAEDKVA